jgi:hypothetical protein
MNKGVAESRTIETAEVVAENIGFPFAAQAALLLRQRTGRKDELVALLTDLPPQELDASQWLEANRQCWGIESGLHQRLDVSFNDDRCRVRSPRGIWVLGMFRRLANSIAMEWRQRQPNPKYKTITDFHADLGENNLAKAMRFISCRHPTL